MKEVARRADVVLVIGSKNSSNSNRLAEVSRERGTPAYLVDDESEVDPAWLDGAEVVGLTSGASAPEWLVTGLIEWLAAQRLRSGGAGADHRGERPVRAPPGGPSYTVR